ncbi:MAG: PhzF family phenazine biosynthesis protein [Bacteroidota bacterium]
MKIPIYQVDAFSDQLFGGNPAAVCPLEEWLPNEIMLKIAQENNLSETAFLVKEKESLRIRWFTPGMEVVLCGHATLASAYVLFHELDHEGDIIYFQSLSGQLSVKRDKDYLVLDFPADKVNASKMPEGMAEALGKTPKQVFKGKTDYLLIYPHQNDIIELSPDFGMLAKVDCRGIIASAKGRKVDFVSRFFAPRAGVNEDPVTGSAHTTLTPYWSKRLEKTELEAHQLSKRGGKLRCQLRGDRVLISGKGCLYLKGEIYI